MTDQPFPKNPYVIGVPLTGDFGFYGRRAVFTFVEDTLNTEQQNVIVLYGQRRVGKTSLLHQLVKQLKGEVLPVHFDLQGRAQQSLGQVLYELARTVARPLKMSVSEQAKFDNAGRFFREEFLPSVYQLLGQRRLLLLFDEFDVLGDELTSPEAASETLFPYLQSLIMHERQIVFIFVVGRRIEELATHFQAIFKQAVYRRVGLLKPEDARTLIVEPVKEVLTFEESAIEAILNLTAGHPYFTQLICSELFNAMKANNQHIVIEADVLKLVNQAIESGHGALNWFWDGLPRAERFIMSAVAYVTDETGLASKEAIRQILEKHRIILTGLELTDAPDKLVEWEMLRREGPDNYRFVVELVRRWIIKTHPLESARRDIDFMSQRAVRSYENAREAHSAGSASDLEYALEEYRRALAANPNHSGAQLGLAQVLFELGQIEAAIEEFSKAYALDEMSARDGLVQAHLAQGKKLEEASQPNEAMLQYEQALKMAPTHEITRQRLGDIWRKRGDTAIATEGLTAAFESYQKALDFDHNDTIAEKIKISLDNYARKAVTDHNYDEAIEATQQLEKLGLINQTELNSRFAAIWLEHGHASLAEADLMSTIKSYQQTLAFDRCEATTRSIHSKLGAYAQQAETDQKHDEAIEAISQLRKLLPDDKNVLDSEINLWTRRGDALVKEKESAEAIKAYQRAFELSPGDPSLTQKLEAINAEWEKLLEIERIFSKAIVAYQAKDWAIAEAGWLQLLKLDVLDYKEHSIATLLAETREKRKFLQQEQQTLFKQGWKAQQDQDWTTAEAVWQQLIDQGVQTYEGQELHSLLIKAKEGRITQEAKERQILFEKGLKAQQAQDWVGAEVIWQQLMDRGVKTHNGREIESLAIEAKERRIEQEQRDRERRKERERLERERQKQERRKTLKSILIIGSTVVALTIGGIILSSYQSSQNTAPNFTTSSRQIQIIFSSDRDGNWEIYTLGADGIVKRLTNNQASDREPTWSPDGSKLAFSSDRDGNWEIYTLGADGIVKRLTNNQASDREPTWSPDGSKLAFSSDRAGNWEIYTLGADSVVKRLTNNQASDREPTWSPDGSKLAFSSDRAGNWEIYTLGADSVVKRLTNNQASDREPTWSPDGSKLAFSSDRAGNWEIYTLGADSVVKRLTNNQASDREPTWSPDGSKLAFSSDRAGNWEIYTLDSDSVVSRFTDKGVNYNPDWEH